MSYPLVPLLEACNNSKSGISPFKGEKQYLNTGNLDLDRVISTETITYRNRPSRANRSLKHDDVIFAKMQNTIKVLHIDSEELSSYVVSTGFVVLHPTEKLYSKYLKYFLLSGQFNRKKDSLCNGATQRAINDTNLAKLKIPLPSFAEQKHIIEILEKSDDLRKKRQECVHISDKFLEASFYEMFSRYLNTGTQDKSINLGDVIKIGRKIVDPRKPEYQKLPHINGEVIESKTGKLLQYKKISEENLISGKFIFEQGDVLYNKIRPYLCKAAIPEFRGLCSADMYPITPETSFVLPEYLLWLLLSDEFTAYAVKCSTRARMPKLNRAELFAFRTSLPPLSEQKKFAELTQECKKIKEKQQESENKLDILFDSMIQKTFYGA